MCGDRDRTGSLSVHSVCSNQLSHTGRGCHFFFFNRWAIKHKKTSNLPRVIWWVRNFSCLQWGHWWAFITSCNMDRYLHVFYFILCCFILPCLYMESDFEKGSVLPGPYLAALVVIISYYILPVLRLPYLFLPWTWPLFLSLHSKTLVVQAESDYLVAGCWSALWLVEEGEGQRLQVSWPLLPFAFPESSWRALMCRRLPPLSLLRYICLWTGLLYLADLLVIAVRGDNLCVPDTKAAHENGNWDEKSSFVSRTNES